MVREFVLPAMADRVLQKLASSLVGLVSDLREQPFLADGRLVESVAFVAGTAQLVDHGLGRRVRGFLEVTPADATTRVGLAPSWTSSVDLTRQVRVTPTATGTCHLWVY